MAEQKRFYWIKLKENFFDLETIDWLISQKNGCEYIVLYQKLCLMSANKNGRLAMEIGEMIVPYDANKIARDTKFDIDTVIVAMELFQRIGLIYEETDGVLKIPYVNEIVGSETPAAIKKRKQREKKKLQQGDKVGDNVLQENRDKILDNRFLEKEKDAEEVNGANAPDYNDPDDQLQIFKGLLLSENQMGHLLDIMGLEVFDEYCARLSCYIENNNAIVKSHYQTLLKWYNEDRGVKK
jgi:predicted phage replisome organizer